MAEENCYKNDQGLVFLPPRPEEPLLTDCCGSGCNPCVFDIYEKDLKAWKKECEEITKNGNKQQKSHDDSTFSSTNYQSLKLISVTKLSCDSAIYQFKLPEKTQLVLDIGQHLLLRSKLDGKIITRPYTPISCEDGYFNVMIKLYPTGRMSQCISKWSVGDLVDWRGPFGKFTYKSNQYNNIIMLAAGTGIAPMLQVIKGVLDNDDEETFLYLMYSCKKASDILMKEQLAEYKQFWNFKVVYFLTQSNQKDDKEFLSYGDTVNYTRIDKEALMKEFPMLMVNAKVLICGTKSFDKDMINYALSMGYKDGQIFIF